MTDGQAPVWVKNEFFQNILENHLKKKVIRVLKYTFKDVLAVGENYVTCVSRSCVTYTIPEDSAEKKTINLILKYLPQNELMRYLVNELKLFEYEAHVYTNILPTVNKISLEGNGKLGISASCIYSRVDKDCKDPVIVLEDLAELNFKMYSREQSLDLQHCLIALKKLAYLHAATFDMQNKGHAFEKYNKGLFVKADYFITWIRVGLNSLTANCSTHPDLKKYAAKLERLKGTEVDRTMEAQTLGDFNVLNHGDAWTNNFLFCYKDGKLKDLRLVDFQFVYYGSPAIDLHYFWAISPMKEIRLEHFDTMFDYYYTNLLVVCKELHCDLGSVPSKENLIADFKARAFYGLATLVCAMPLFLANQHGVNATFENLLNEESELHKHAYSNDRYISHIEQLLPFYDALGILD